MVKKVLILGAPSTGKTTTVKELSRIFREPYVKEFGAEVWLERNVDKILSIEDLKYIASQQYILEKFMSKFSNKFLFCDTGVITTALFCFQYHNRIPEYFIDYIKATKFRYYRIFLLENNIPYDDTWDRDGEEKQKEMQENYKKILNLFLIPHYIVKSSTLIERIEEIQIELFRCKQHRI